jgi:hypothetical protein
MLPTVIPATPVGDLPERPDLHRPLLSGRGGRKGTRTPDILLVREALYQLSYAPSTHSGSAGRGTD